MRVAGGVVGCAATLMLCSCMQMLIMTAPDPVEEVTAEFDKLPGRRVLVLVWAEAATVFEYPHIQFELARYVNYHLKTNVDPIALITAREVAAYQRDTPGWESLPLDQVGSHFDVDYVIYLELPEYTIRGPGTQYLLAGRGRVAMSVYDVHGPGGRRHVYRGEAQGRFPESGNLGEFDTDAVVIHNGTLNTLGLAAARKFFDHEIPQ